MAYNSTTAVAKGKAALEQLADDVVAAIEAEVAAGGSLFKIATGAGMVPSDLAAFLGPDAGDGTYPQHQSMVTIEQASQILSGADDWITDAQVEITLDPARPV